MEIRPSSIRLAGLLAISCTFVAIGVWMIRDGNALGWFELAFFGVGALVFVIALARGMGLSLDEDGFTLATIWRSSTFEWRDVSEFVVGSAARQKMILFDDRPQGNLSDINRRLTGHNCAIPAVMTSGSMQEVCDQLNAFRARALSEESP